MSRLSAAIAVLCSAALAVVATPASVAVAPAEATAAAGHVRSTPNVVVPYLATDYRYRVVRFGEGNGFQQPTFDDSGFLVGDAGFGTPEDLGTGCPLNNPVDVRTPWPVGTDILLRKEFNLPTSATRVNVSVAIDNDVQVFVNGHDISGGLREHEGCASRGSFTFTAGPALVHSGANLLAVRARDRGAISYTDFQVSFETRLTTTLSWKNETTGSDHGFGSAAVRIADERVCFGLRWSRIPTPSAAHIHKGPSGSDGPVVVPLFTGAPGPNATAGTAWGCVTASDDVAADIGAHPDDYYVNVHTPEFPDGAVRGQLARER
jgi:hypothetical protein